MIPCKIYTLADPDTLEVRYVGQTTKSLKVRLRGHLDAINNCKRNSYKNNWIKSLLKKNKKPIIELLEEGIWNESEIYWIAQFKAWGFNLVNNTLGGSGGLGMKVSEETRKKLSKPKTKKKFTFISPDNKILSLTIEEGAKIIGCKKESIYQGIWRSHWVKGWVVLSNHKKN